MKRRLATLAAATIAAGTLAGLLTGSSAQSATTTIPRDPFPRQFFLLLGTGEPRTTFTPPYTAMNCASKFYQPTSSWYLTCAPQLYVYPTPSGRVPLKLGEAGTPTP